MTDLENMLFLKLRPVTDSRLTEQVTPLLCEGEAILQPFQGLRDGVVFTDRRVIAVNTQGFTGKRRPSSACPTAASRPFRWNPPACWIWTVKCSCGSRASGSSPLS